MMRTACAYSAGEENNHRTDNEEKQHHYEEHPPERCAVAIAPHVPGARHIIPLRWLRSGCRLRLLSNRLEWLNENNEGEDRKSCEFLQHNAISVCSERVSYLTRHRRRFALHLRPQSSLLLPGLCALR